MRQLKAGATVAFALAGAGTVHANVTGRLYPMVPLAFFLSAAALVVAVGRSDRDAGTLGAGLVVVVALALWYRAFVFLFPESLIGIDPVGYSFQIQQVMDQGRLDVIDSWFYSEAPLFYIVPASYGLLVGVDASTALVIYPLFVGAVIPLCTAALVRQVSPDISDGVCLIAAIIASTATVSLSFAFTPIAQTLAVVLWFPLLVLLFQYHVTGTRRAMALIVVLLFALSFTHKLPILVVLGTLVAFSGLLLVQRVRFSAREIAYFPEIRSFVANRAPAVSRTRSRERTTARDRPPVTDQAQGVRGSAFLSRIPNLLALTGVVLAVQWMYQTNFIWNVANMLLFTSPNPPLPEPIAAVSPSPGPFGTLIQYGHALALFAFGGFAWFYLLYRNQWRSWTLLAGTAAGGFPFVVWAFGMPFIDDYTRSVGLVEPLIAAIVVIAHTASQPRTRLSASQERAILVVVAILLIGLQLAAIGAVPDHPADNRDYLTKAEVEGTEFGEEYATDLVYTDYYLMIAHLPEPADDEAGYEAFNEELIDGDLPEPDGHVAYRTDVDIYLTQHARGQQTRWVLTWDPEPELDSARNRVYANGAITLYDDRESSVGEGPRENEA